MSALQPVVFDGPAFAGSSGYGNRMRYPLRVALTATDEFDMAIWLEAHKAVQS